MTDPVLEADDLTIQYRTEAGPVTAVSEASFTIEDGQYFGLVGESGCGKSTIAKAVIGGLDDNGEITGGALRYRGREIQDMTQRELNREIRWTDVAMIPQGSMNSLNPLQRIRDQATELVSVHTDMTQEEGVDRLRDLFDVVGLQPDRIADYPHQFSGGMQQRAIIALALLLEPSLIVADEPTTALDVIMQDQIFAYLEDIQAETDVSMLLITHDISVVFESCDEMAIMHAGQIAEQGSVTEVYDSPRHPYSILLQRAFPDFRYPERDLEVIEGSPPQLYGEVDRCTFADRCPWATEECREGAPETTPVTGGAADHTVACVREAEIPDLLAAEDRQSGASVEADAEGSS